MIYYVLAALGIGGAGAVVTTEIIPRVRRARGGAAKLGSAAKPIPPAPVVSPTPRQQQIVKGSPLSAKLRRANLGSGIGYVVESGLYKIQQGDSWASLASAMRVPVAVLQSYNKGLPMIPGIRIFVVTPVSRLN